MVQTRCFRYFLKHFIVRFCWNCSKRQYQNRFFTVKDMSVIFSHSHASEMCPNAELFLVRIFLYSD